MIKELIIIILKALIGLAARMVVLFLLWNYAIAPAIGAPIMSFLTIFWFWLAYNVLANDFSIQLEEVPNDEGEE